VEVGEEALHVRMDAARMRQVLLNLLGNALKFTDKGEVRLRAWSDPAAREVRLCVEDTGIGIAKEKQGLLFRKFSQVDGSYRRRHQGAGLGLTISRSLVERMHGSIAIESEGIGMGTRVTLSFPADAGDGAGTGATGSRECHATS
jgi:signal transduction histidine kinase